MGIGNLIRRLILGTFHLAVLVVSYVVFFFEEIRLLVFGGKKAAEMELKKLKKVPKHLAIVIDEQDHQLNRQITQTVNFAAEIPGMESVIVFQRRGKTLKFENPKIRVFGNDDVEPEFVNAMESKKNLKDLVEPFGARIDLVIIYSRSSSLCNFFPWTMDLATFVFAGPAVKISPLSLIESMVSFEKAEQRFGK